MSRKTKITALPALPPNVDPQLKPILHAIKEALEVQVGHRGEQLDKAVTFRDLSDAGMADFRFDNNTGGRLLPITNPGDQSTPPVPHSLAANGTFTNVLLSWQGGFRHTLVAATEVYRNTTDDLLTATFVGSTSAHIYVDTVEPGTTHYYWVRFRSPVGVLSPFNGTDGTSATTSRKVSDIIDDLSDELNQSHLSSVLSTKIDAIAINGTSISTEVSARIAAINAEIAARSTGDGTLQGNIDTVSATVTAHGTNITSNANAVAALVIRVTDNEGDITTSATDITALETTVNHGTTGVAATASGLSSLSTTVSTNTTGISTNATDITALETTVNNPTTGVAASASGLTTLSTTVSTQGSAITAQASSITSLNSTVGNNSAAITDHTSTIDGISAEKYVKIDVNGNVSGYGIYSGPTGSEFAVNADVFKIANGASKTVPFSVVGGVTYMNSAMIADASIDVAKINNLTLDMAQVTGTLSANQVDAGLITSDMIEADGISANKITIDGNIEFANTQSGVQFGKTSLGDTQAGAFFGRSGGASGFNISSSTSGIYADSAGTVSLNNVRLYTGVPGSALEHGNPGTHVANISALSTSIYIVVVGAGAGACNTGVPSVWGSVAAQPGAAGSSSWIQFCSGLNGSGSVLATYTASGAPATPHVVGPNNATAYGYSGLASSQANSAGAGGAPNVHGAAGYRGGGGGGAGIAGYNYSGNAYVRIHAQAGQTVSQLVAKPANAQSVKMFVGTGGAGGAYYHPASPNGNNPARYTYTGGRGGHGFVTIADPNSGGVEVDLLSIVNRLNAAGI